MNISTMAKLTLLINLVVSMQVSADVDMQQACANIARKIAEDNSLKSTQDKIKTWETYKDQCAGKGVYHSYLADFYAGDGRLKESRELSEWIVKNPTFDTRFAEKNLVILDSLEKKTVSEKNRIDLILKKYPNWYAGYALLGFFELRELRNFIKARESFEKANALEESAEAYSGLTIVHYLLNEYQKAVDAYQKALDLDLGIIINKGAAAAAVDSAMILGYWGGAQAVLTAQKEGMPSIVEDPIYLSLKKRLDNYLADKCNKMTKTK